ncbi:hypothetical protein [Winogradskyella sp. 3972H.M.0a.05]|uniref:hypothetical protein n=1 Tax=Winogradskyella sp. 3972H.M.0a.05 TaxID=2950277 RepID=UPI003392148E
MKILIFLNISFGMDSGVFKRTNSGREFAFTADEDKIGQIKPGFISDIVAIGYDPTQN